MSRAREMAMDKFALSANYLITRRMVKKLGPLVSFYLTDLIERNEMFCELEETDLQDWFWFSSVKQCHSLRITEKISRKLKKELKTIGVLQLKREGMPAKLYHKINYEKLEQILYGNN